MFLPLLVYIDRIWKEFSGMLDSIDSFDGTSLGHAVLDSVGAEEG